MDARDDGGRPRGRARRGDRGGDHGGGGTDDEEEEETAGPGRDGGEDEADAGDGDGRPKEKKKTVTRTVKRVVEKSEEERAAIAEERELLESDPIAAMAIDRDSVSKDVVKALDEMAVMSWMQALQMRHMRLMQAGMMQPDRVQELQGHVADGQALMMTVRECVMEMLRENGPSSTT